jgi:Alpha-L-arabinofuranosidase B, catalytic
MGLSGILGTGLTATTNQNPNSLATASPYPKPYVNYKTVSIAWLSQGVNCLFPKQARNGAGLIPIPVLIVPSVANATFTATVWQYDKTSNTWFQNKSNPSVNYTGEAGNLILNLYTNLPTYIQITSLSSGSVSIYFDNGLADLGISVSYSGGFNVISPSGEIIHNVSTSGLTLDSTSSTLVTALADQTNNHTATASATSWVNAPRFAPVGINGVKPGLYFPGAGFVALNYDTGAYTIKNNVPGISAVMTLSPDGSAASNQPFLFISQGTNSGTSGFVLGCTYGNALYGAFRRLDTSSTGIVTTPQNFYTPGETFVLMVIVDYAVGNGVDPLVKFYKNGVLVYSAPLTGQGIGNTSPTNALTFNIGGPSGNAGTNIIIGETYLYPKALSNKDSRAKNSILMLNAGINGIQITSPTSYQGFNRNLQSNTQNITISGTYDTNLATQPTAIEANWSANGSTYTTIASNTVGSFGGGVFSGTLSSLPPGQGTLTVRFVNDTSQSCQRSYITISDAILFIGQSNNTDVLDPTYSDPTLPQNPKTYTLDKAGMVVPVFNSRFAFGKWFDLQKCSTYAVAFAQDYELKHGYPPLLIFIAIGGTSSQKWRSDDTNLYGNQIGQSYYDTFGLGLNLLSRALLVGNVATSNTGVNAIFDEQGEADCGSSGTSQATFLANKTNTFGTLLATYPNAVIMNALLQQQLDSSGSDISRTNVNGAIQQGWTSIPGNAPGADLSSLVSDHRAVDGGGLLAVHLISNSNVAAQAAAWATAAQTAMGYGTIMDELGLGTAYPAWSLGRKLRTAYAGNAIQVRRSSDNTTQDIGFDAYGNLNTASLLAFMGTGNGYVSKVYDQGTLGADWVQATTSKQCLIVNGGVLKVQNAKPCMAFDQTATYYDMASGGLGLLNAVSGLFTSVAMSETQDNDASPGYRIIYSYQISTATTNTRFSTAVSNNGGVNNQLGAVIRKNDGGGNVQNNSGGSLTYTGTTPFIYQNKQDWNGATNTFYLNGVSGGAFATGQTSGTTDATNSTAARLGASNASTPIQYSHMNFSEMILIPSAISDINRVKLAHSQGFFYGIPVS